MCQVIVSELQLSKAVLKVYLIEIAKLVVTLQ